MSDTSWYYADASQQRQGPLSTQELRRLHHAGQIDIDTLVWCAGMPQWNPLHGVAELSPQASAHDPYTAPASSLEKGSGQALAALDSNLQAYEVFVGRNFPVYQRKWRLAKEASNANSWNWPAFLFGAFWMLYRRMYAVATGWIVVLFGLSIAEGFIGASSNASTTITLGAGAAAGSLGNHLYLWHANRIIAEARMRHPDNEQALHAELARRGGTRWWAVGLGLLTCMLVLGALSFLFDR